METIIRIENEELLSKCSKEIKRVAVKAIIFVDGNILLIRTKKGDYKFPGGGLKEDEVYIDALKREVIEETGYEIKKVIKPLISVVEKKLDLYEQDTVFIMESTYFICELNSNIQYKQSLDEYEEELDFKAEFVNLKDIYATNVQLLEEKHINMNPWISRENAVMKKLIEMGYYIGAEV